MQKLGTGLLINRMLVDGVHTYCERMDGSWQSGTDRDATVLTDEDCLAIGNYEIRAAIETAIAQRGPRPVPPCAPSVSEDDELASLVQRLSPAVKDDLMALLRARVGPDLGAPAAAPADDPTATGYVYTDPETGHKRWIPGDMTPEEVSAAHPCPHCGKVWDSERAVASHTRQCAENPSSRNFKGIMAAADDLSEFQEQYPGDGIPEGDV